MSLGKRGSAAEVLISFFFSILSALSFCASYFVVRRVELDVSSAIDPTVRTLPNALQKSSAVPHIIGTVLRIYT